MLPKMLHKRSSISVPPPEYDAIEAWDEVRGP